MQLKVCSPFRKLAYRPEKRYFCSWGAFFGSKPEKSAAERLAELRKMREQAEQEKARKELEKIRVSERRSSEHCDSSGCIFEVGFVAHLCLIV